MDRQGSKILTALVGTIAALTLAACGAVPSQNGTANPPDPTSGGDLPSPTTVIPSESPSSSSSSASSPSPSDPATPTPTPTPTEPAGPDCAKLKCIALTWDDGPGPDTSRLTRIMRQEKVKGTFFMLGQQVREYPQAVKDVQATGSELANHSWNHPSLPKLGTSGMRSQLVRTNDEIEKVTGVQVTAMRPPYGENNQQLNDVTKKLGLAQFYWNVDTLDWKYRDADRLVNYVIGNAARNEVVLMHDIHTSTVNGAQAVFRGLKKKGFTMVTVSELYPKARPGGHYPLYQGRGYAKKSDYPKS